MGSFPTSAKVVIVGAGIVGNSIAYHLAKLGWKDILLIDKGPLPNTGGSTGHASNFIFPVDHSKEMTQLTLESQRQYVEMGVNTECGGIEVARTEERMEEFRRRMASAKSWGVDSARLVTPAEIKELVPYIDESILVGGFYTPGVGVCDSLQFGTLCREKAEAMGALTVFANTEVTGMEGEMMPAIGPTAACWWQGSSATSPRCAMADAASMSPAQPSNRMAPAIAPCIGPHIPAQSIGGPACRIKRACIPGIRSRASPMPTSTGRPAAACTDIRCLHGRRSSRWYSPADRRQTG